MTRVGGKPLNVVMFEYGPAHLGPDPGPCRFGIEGLSGSCTAQASRPTAPMQALLLRE